VIVQRVHWIIKPQYVRFSNLSTNNQNLIPD